MKKITLFIIFASFVFFSGTLFSQTIFTVKEVYSDTTLQNGDTIAVVGYYTDTTYNFLIDFYGNWDKDEPMGPNTFIVLEGLVPPQNACNGGYLIAHGVVKFEPYPDAYHPEDSLLAHLDVFIYDVLMEGDTITYSTPGGSYFYGGLNSDAGCDSCKFAILISGGINPAKNHGKYWENLVALYHFKVDSSGYCKDNVFVHYYQGVRRDNRIPQDRIKKADTTNISNSFKEISRRVAKCKAQQKPVTFQKMVTNHGADNGDISLLNDGIRLKPTHLRKMQQNIIDSCCSLIYEEFLQCFGGICVDEMKNLNTKNKTKVYVNSNADNQAGYSPHHVVHPYLRAKIDSLDKGKSYEDAVIGGKLAYDNYLRQRINRAHDRAQRFRNDSTAENAAAELTRWIKDSTERSNRISTSRNVTLTPMKKYCQWEKFVVPPGGQLVLDFGANNNSNINNCGNVTVYWDDPVTGKKKYKVFNWNLPGSKRHSGNNKQRVVNGSATGSRTFWVHNDNGPFKLTASATGNQNLPQDSSKTYDYPGTSFGGDDNSGAEFTTIVQPNMWIQNIDQVPFMLNDLPSHLGPGYVEILGGSFYINPGDIYASNMQLHLDIIDVQQPGILLINSSGSLGQTTINITGPGEYNVPLGDMRFEGPMVFFELNATGTIFGLDCWGIHTIHQSNIPNVELCSGSCTTLAASGGETYLWSTGETTESINVCPLNTATYTVTITDIAGGTLLDEAVVTVHPSPTVIATSNSPVNYGSDLQLNGEATQQGLFPGGYCIPMMNNAYEWITNVVFDGFPNPSGQDPNGYGDYTGTILTNVIPGGSYPIEVMIFPDSPPEWVTVFIDLNRNGIFEPHEETFLGDAMGGMTAGLINIPPDATPGETALRVILRWGDIPEFDPCNPGAYGETEDYKIMINGIMPAPIETWDWTGPNAFTSMEQNPLRPNMTTADAGIYTLTAATENGCSGSADIFVEVIADKAMVSTKTILQGNYAGGGQMTTNLNPIIPIDQPFNRLPWNYMGMENLNPLPIITFAPVNMVDWILVELRDASDSSLIVAQRAAILLDNGSVVDTNLSNSISFEGTPPGNYYICLHHRNSLPVMSANPVTLPNSVLFDFSDPAANPPYGGIAQALIELEPGIYGMIGGDVNSDGILKYSGPGNDRALVLQLIVNQTGSSSITATTDGYFDEDNNMNGTVKYSGPQNDPSLIIQNIVTLTGSPSITSVFSTPVPREHKTGAVVMILRTQEMEIHIQLSR